MANNEVTRLNIGAGVTRIPGFVNIDIAPYADISLDLNRDRLPFADDSVDLVFSYHALEHMDNYLFALGEIHRVLKHGGYFLLGVPYVTLTKYNLVNPYHRQNFNEFSFDLFDPKKVKGSAAEENAILFHKVFHRFHYLGGFYLVPPPLRGWCRNHLFNVVKKIDFGLQAIKDPADSSLHGLQNPGAMKRLFRECMAQRVKYSASEKAQTPNPARGHL